jgi:hypothetical protein
MEKAALHLSLAWIAHYLTVDREEGKRLILIALQKRILRPEFFERGFIIMSSFEALLNEMNLPSGIPSLDKDGIRIAHLNTTYEERLEIGRAWILSEDVDGNAAGLSEIAKMGFKSNDFRELAFLAANSWKNRKRGFAPDDKALPLQAEDLARVLETAAKRNPWAALSALSGPIDLAFIENLKTFPPLNFDQSLSIAKAALETIRQSESASDLTRAKENLFQKFPEFSKAIDME